MNASIQLPDFDTLLALHRSDPAAYEALRSSLLQKCVAEAPREQQPALERLIMRMEDARAGAATPLEAAVAASRMMIDSVEAMRNELTHLLEGTAARQTAILMDKLRRAR